jgi:cytochrome c-type biogenesis protein CcmF
MAPLLVILPFGPFLAWKRGDLVAVVQRLAIVAGIALFAAVLVALLRGALVSMAPLGLLLGFWVALGAIAELVDRARFGRMALGQSLRRLFGLPRTAWSTALAHFGLGVSVIGIVTASAWSSEAVTTVRAGEMIRIENFDVMFSGVEQERGPNYVADIGTLTVDGPLGSKRVIHPERRVYTASGMPTTEAAIETFGFSQLYVQLGETSSDGLQVVRVWYKPWVTLIWLGCVIMAGAGLLSLSYRRLRVGAPKPAAQRTAPAE